MTRTIKRTSSHAGFVLCVVGCSGSASVTFDVPTRDAGPAPTPTTGTPVGAPIATDAGIGGSEICNQTGISSCDVVLDAMCQRFVQCCQGSPACQPWATDVGRCKARFYETDASCTSPEFANRLVCPSATKICQDDVSLVSCSDLAAGTANWPPSCNAYWKQFASPATGTTTGTTTGATTPTAPIAISLVAQNGKCMDVQSNQTANGTKIQLWQCNGTGNQSFRIEDAGGGAVRVVHVYSNKCIDVRSAGTSDCTPIQLNDCNGTGAQSFTYRKGGGSFSLVNTKSGKCVDIQSNRSDNGAPFQIYSCNGTGAQLFQTKASNAGGAPGSYTGWVDMTNNPYACTGKNGAPCGWTPMNYGQGYTCGLRHPEWANPWTCER